MPLEDPRVDAYIAKAAPFAPILKHLRKVVHAGCPKVQGTIKCQSPHFDYKGVMCGKPLNSMTQEQRHPAEPNRRIENC
jgi:hypothetical protein